MRFQKIKITSNGKSQYATVEDLCPSCAEGALGGSVLFDYISFKFCCSFVYLQTCPLRCSNTSAPSARALFPFNGSSYDALLYSINFAYFHFRGHRRRIIPHTTKKLYNCCSFTHLLAR